MSLAAPVATICGPGIKFAMNIRHVTIGRVSHDIKVANVEVGESTCISRKHLEVHFVDEKFYMKCIGKNGIFLDNEYLPPASDYYTLPENKRMCQLRFPSTQIILTIYFLHSNNKREKPKGGRGLALQVAPPAEKSPQGNGNSDDILTFDPYLREQFLPRCRSAPAEMITVPFEEEEVEESHESHEEDDANKMALEEHAHFEFSMESPDEDSAMPNLHPAVDATDEGTTTVNTSVATDGAAVPVSPLFLPGTHCAVPADFDPGSLTKKPPYSYAQIIIQAILSSSDKRMTLSSIYDFISATYPYYKPGGKGWQNSIRHNLSLNRYFVRLPRSQDDAGKGSFWSIDSRYEATLTEQAFVRRRHGGGSTGDVAITETTEPNGRPSSPGNAGSKTDAGATKRYVQPLSLYGKNSSVHQACIGGEWASKLDRESLKRTKSSKLPSETSSASASTTKRKGCKKARVMDQLHQEQDASSEASEVAYMLPDMRLSHHIPGLQMHGGQTFNTMHFINAYQDPDSGPARRLGFPFRKKEICAEFHASGAYASHNGNRLWQHNPHNHGLATGIPLATLAQHHHHNHHSTTTFTSNAFSSSSSMAFPFSSSSSSSAAAAAVSGASHLQTSSSPSHSSMSTSLLAFLPFVKNTAFPPTRHNVPLQERQSREESPPPPMPLPQLSEHSHSPLPPSNTNTSFRPPNLAKKFFTSPFRRQRTENP